MRAVPHHERWSIHLAAVRNNPTLEYDIGHVGQPVRERGCAENVLSANARDTLVAIECDDLYRHAAPDCDRQEQTHTCYGHRTELMGRACSPGQEWHRGRHREKAYKPRPERGMSRNENVRCRALDPHRTIETTWDRGEIPGRLPAVRAGPTARFGCLGRLALSVNVTTVIGHYHNTLAACTGMPANPMPSAQSRPPYLPRSRELRDADHAKRACQRLRTRDQILGVASWSLLSPFRSSPLDVAQRARPA
jgi:hypothetical protein